MSKKPSKHQIQSLPVWFIWAFSLLTLIAVPLFYYKPAIDVTLTPKFVLLSFILLIVFLVLLIREYRTIPLQRLIIQWPVLAWLAFMVISVASMLFAFNPWEGVFDLFHLGLSLCFLLALVSVFTLNPKIRPFSISFLVLAAVLVSIGFYQYFTYVFGNADLESLYKINGWMSHKNVFSGVIFLTIPFLAYSILRGIRWERIAGAALLVAVLILLLLLQTRSLWLAVLVFLLVCGGFAVLFPKARAMFRLRSMRPGLLLIASAFIISVLAGSAITSVSVTKADSESQGTKPVNTEITGLGERAASILDNKTDNRQKRIVIWKYTLQMIADHPLLGVGGGNWKILAPGYYEPGYMTTHYHNWRRPHNDFLHIAAEKGVVGLLAYLAFLCTLVWFGIQVVRRSDDPERILLVILSLAAIAGFSVDSMFSFPFERIDEQMFLMFFAGIIIHAHMEVGAEEREKSRRQRPWLIYSVIVFLLVAIPLGRKWVKAEVYTNEAFMYNNNSRWQSAVQVIDKAYSPLTQIDPSNNPLLWFRGKAYMNLNNYRQAQEDLEAALQLAPHSITVLTELGVLYGRMGNHQKALETFRKAYDVYPLDRFVLTNMSMAYYHLGQYQESLNCLYQCLTDKEDPQLNQMISNIKEKLFGPPITEGTAQEGSPS